MTVTVSNVLSGGGAPSGGNNTTASWTPDGTSQAILSVSSYVSTGSTVPTITSVTGNGLTWTQVAVVHGDNTGADRSSEYMFVAPAGGSAGTIVIAWAAAVPSKASWTLDKVAGADSGLGSGTLPQAAKTGTSSGLNPSATLANALQSGSVTYAAADFESSAGTLTAGSGYTALAQNTSQSLAWIISEWNSAGSTTGSASNSTTSNRHSIILIEVAAAASGTTWPVTQTDSAGLTDTATIDRTLAVTDDTGLTDTAALARTVVSADDTGLTDSSTLQLAKTATATDNTGLTDTKTLSRSLAATDTTGLTDTAALARSLATTDAAGLTDNATQQLAKIITAVDDTGLTDTNTISRTLAATDTAGLSDTAALARTLTQSDSAGLTDTATQLKAQLVTVTDTAGLTDTITISGIRATPAFVAIGGSTTASSMSGTTHGSLVSGATTTIGTPA